MRFIFSMVCLDEHDSEMMIVQHSHDLLFLTKKTILPSM